MRYLWLFWGPRERNTGRMSLALSERWINFRIEKTADPAWDRNWYRNWDEIGLPRTEKGTWIGE